MTLSNRIVTSVLYMHFSEPTLHKIPGLLILVLVELGTDPGATSGTLIELPKLDQNAE